MTDKGTFVINGTERVVVSQLVRSLGVYFERTADKTSDKDVYTAKVIPSRGAWLEFEIDKRDAVGVRVDRKRKQSVTVLLKALGMTSDQILEHFGDYESMRATLEKDHTTDQDDCTRQQNACSQKISDELLQAILRFWSFEITHFIAFRSGCRRSFRPPRPR